jgi:hypothetical protein
MRKFRLVSVAFAQLAVVVGLIALPTAGRSAQPQPPSAPSTVLNWIPPLSSSLMTSSLCDFFTPVCPTTPTTVRSSTGLIPMWLCSSAANSATQCANYQFAMVGNDPTVKNSPAVTVPTRIIPMRFTFTSTASPPVQYVFDAENNDVCSPLRTPALNMAQNSPMFAHMSNATLPSQLKPFGPGQYASLFQRATFWTYAQPKAIDPGYQVNLEQVLLNSEESIKKTITIVDVSVPPVGNQINGTVMTNSNWCNPLAVIEVNQLDALLQDTIIPALKGAGLTPAILPIFLFSNVAMYDSTLAGCCILSYHNAYKSITTGATAGRLQTYIVANYDSTYCPTPTCKVTIPGAFPLAGSVGGPDTVALSTVIAGWMDNPTTLNATTSLPAPATWSGTVDGITQCQTAVEVGFAPKLSVQSVTMPSKVIYHVQDLAFKSWFYRDGSSSSTVNSGYGGQYSLFSDPNFKALPPLPCS